MILHISLKGQVLFSVLLMILYGCSSKDYDYNDIDIILLPDKTLFFSINQKPITGKVIEHTDFLKSEIMVKNGKINGLFYQFHSNGNILSKIEYNEGKMNGKMTTFFSDGEEKIITFYKDNMINGSFENFYPSGQIKQCASYHLNILTDKRYEFYETGGIAIYKY